MITLPTTPLPPSRVWPKLLYLYGQKKVGKTEALSKLPGCLILETDPEGADFLTCLRVQLNSMADYEEAVAALVQQKKPYKFVAVDTAVMLEEWCEYRATEMYKNSTIGKNFKGDSVLALPEGAGYLWLRLAFQTALRKLMVCADNIILTGHLKDKYLKSMDTKEKGKDSIDVYSRDIDHTGKIRSMVSAGADALGYLYRTLNPATKTEKLWVSFQTSEAVTCGTRCPHLAGKNFEFDWELIYPGLNKQETTQS